MKTPLKNILTAILVLWLFNACNSQHQSPVSGADSTDSSISDKQLYKDLIADLSPSRDIFSLLCQTWTVEDDLEATQSTDDATGDLVSRSFHFFSDHSFVSNPRNELGFGKWSFDDKAKTITLEYDHHTGRTTVYKIGAISAHELKLLKVGEDRRNILTFVSSGLNYKEVKEDPYHIANNLWRIHPEHRETDAEIKARLKLCVHFYCLFYRDALIREEKKISFYGFPTCFKWYAGGIYLIKGKELEKNWDACFYNMEQVRQGYAIMDTLIGKKYVWPKGERNWVKSNLSVLQQMYKEL